MLRAVLGTALVLAAVGCSGEITSDQALSIGSDTSSSVASAPTSATPSTGETDPTNEAATTDSTTRTPVPATPLQGDYTVEVIAALPHDPLAYTQGLEWHEGWLYESTGQYSASKLRRLDPFSGDIDLEVPLDDAFFGEGLTVVDDEVLQLTWQEGLLIRSGVDDLEERSTQTYSGEGWGLCNDGTQLLMSDGSSTLTRRDPITFEVLSTIDVTTDGQPLERLNELECVGTQIFANVYGLDQIAVIDGTTGIVDAVIDAAPLRPPGLSPDDFDYVLNGMAYQPDTGRWFLTGKYWPVLYEVGLVAVD